MDEFGPATYTKTPAANLAKPLVGRKFLHTEERESPLGPQGVQGLFQVA